MFFYTIEAFQPFLERLLPGISCDDLFKITVISNEYQYDMFAIEAAEEAINELLLTEEQEFLSIEFNPDFYPASVAYGEDTNEEEEELIKELELQELGEEDDNLFQIALDGLPRTERDLTINDYIQLTYVLADEEMHALQLRLNIVTTPEAAELIDFDTNRTVH
jgi:hypothetical protein